MERQAEDGAAEQAMGGPKSQETREEMLQRHRKEVKQLQAKDMEMKKAAAKGSKAEQKAKKKQVEETIAKLEAEMKARHAQELRSLDSGAGSSEGGATEQQQNRTEPQVTDGLAAAMKAMGLKPEGVMGVRVQGGGGGEGEDAEAGGVGQGRVSKAQKRRDKKMQAEAERERRIEEEQSNVVSERAVEDARLADQLRPLGLRVKEVKPDGHCLFRAIEDQLTCEQDPGAPAASSSAGPLDYLELRRLAAAHMRAHSEAFIPFLEAEAVEEADGALDSAARFEKYCQRVETTAAWGGQLELQALAKELKRGIVVHCAGKPNIEIHCEGSHGHETEAHAPIRLSYHHHAYGLGEHYNSVVKLPSTGEVEEDVNQGEVEEEVITD